MSVDVGGELDVLRIAVAKVDALAAAAEQTFDNTNWREADPQHLERMAHLIGATAEAAADAVAAVDRFRTAIADGQPAAPGEHW